MGREMESETRRWEWQWVTTGEVEEVTRSAKKKASWAELGEGCFVEDCESH